MIYGKIMARNLGEALKGIDTFKVIAGSVNRSHSIQELEIEKVTEIKNVTEIRNELEIERIIEYR